MNEEAQLEMIVDGIHLRVCDGKYEELASDLMLRILEEVKIEVENMDDKNEADSQ